MAEEDSGQEKTEEPTSKRLEKAREDGQTINSKELTTSVILLVGTSCLMMFGSGYAATMEKIMKHCFGFDTKLVRSEKTMIDYFQSSFFLAVEEILPLFVLLALATIASSVALGAGQISTTALLPKFNKMDPIKGLGKMVSLNSLVELLKSVAKVGLIGSLAVMILFSNQSDLLSMSMESPRAAITHAVTVLGWAAISLAAITIIIALVDVPYQIYDHNKKLKMTMQEVKDEMKDTEGKPEVKGRIRRLQMEIAQRRMMAQVPEADVVITNPTHFAVALVYDQSSSGAPIVVAKGTDEVAMKIREIAKHHNVPQLESPPLARAIYHTTELDHEIPENLYLAVAQVLAYVFQIKSYRPGRGRKPVAPKSFDIPPEMEF